MSQSPRDACVLRFGGGSGRWMQRATGRLFIGLGLRLAMQQRG